MKAVIVDLDGQRAAALCEDGSVREVENLDYSLGQEILIGEEESGIDHGNGQKRANFRIWYKRAAAAAAVVLMLTGIGGVSVYAMPYGEVSLEAGTSVTYTINRFDYVLSAEASDEEGEQILEEVGKKNLVNHKIENAVAVTLDHIEDSERSDPDMEYHVRTDIRSDKGSTDEAHAQKLQGKLEKVLAEKAPEKSEGEPEGMENVPLDRNPEDPETPASAEPASGDGIEEKPEEPEDSFDQQPAGNEMPADKPEENTEDIQDQEPADAGNLPLSGSEGEKPEDPQEQFEEPPVENSEELPREQSHDTMGGPGEDHWESGPK